MALEIHIGKIRESRTEDIMKKLIKKLEDIMVAVTFAEAGEYDEASRLSDNATEQQDAAVEQDFKKPALSRTEK